MTARVSAHPALDAWSSVGKSPYSPDDNSQSLALARWPLFALPETLIATAPAEARGLARDEVRLLVSNDDSSLTDFRFTDFPEFLEPGDVVVVNSSATLNAALPATRADGEQIHLHLSQHLRDDYWIAELRRITDRGTQPLRSAHSGEVIELPAKGVVTLLDQYSTTTNHGPDTRLWLASVTVPQDVQHYLDRYGFPISYGNSQRRWPLSAYQTIFARTPGSAEMPSAGRPFTNRILDTLDRRGVTVATILLHCGVSSLEDNEAPYPEFFRVDSSTVHTVNAARDRGARVIAIGTTVVRALETVAHEDGRVSPAEGWTDLVISPERGLRAVDAMLTGFHEPRSSHLGILESLAGRSHIERAYATALDEQYLWHEFGDVHLILPARR